MQSKSLLKGLTAVLACAGFSHIAVAHDHLGGVTTTPNPKIQAPYDIVHTRIATEGNVATFHIALSGKAGAKLTSNTPSVPIFSSLNYLGIHYVPRSTH